MTIPGLIAIITIFVLIIASSCLIGFWIYAKNLKSNFEKKKRLTKYYNNDDNDKDDE